MAKCCRLRAVQTDMLIKYIARMTETLAQLGYDPGQVLDRAEWAQDQLAQMSGPALQREQYRMIQQALAVTGRDDLGVLVGANMSITDFGPLGMLVASSSTGRMAFRRVFQFLAIAEILWTAKYDLDAQIPFVGITFVDTVPDELHEYFLDEFAAAWNRFSSDLTGQSQWATHAWLPGPETASRLAKSERLGIEFTFEQPGFRFFFNKQMLDAPLINANSEIAEMLEAQCTQIVQGLPNAKAEVDRVRRIVSECLPIIPRASDIADALHTSERSLRRLCANHGTTVRDVILDVRMALACRHLRSSEMTVDQISYLAGYGSPPSFFQAFRKWSGVTPGEFRASSEAEFVEH